MQTNYMQVIEMTEEEKFKMYMRCKKEELVKMLMENQRLLNFVIKPTQQQVDVPYSPTITDPYWLNPGTFCDNSDSITDQKFVAACFYAATN